MNVALLELPMWVIILLRWRYKKQKEWLSSHNPTIFTYPPETAQRISYALNLLMDLFEDTWLDNKALDIVHRMAEGFNLISRGVLGVLPSHDGEKYDTSEDNLPEVVAGHATDDVASQSNKTD